MYIGLPQSQTDSINRSLEAQPLETNDDIKSIFNEAKDFVRSIITDRQLPDFNHKRTLGNPHWFIHSLHPSYPSGAYRDVDTLSTTKPSHFIEELLRLKFESYYKPNVDDWNSMKNSKEYGQRSS